MEPVSSDQLATWAGEARERWSVPGIAVGLLRDGVAVTAADGVRELGRDEAVRPDDVFRIASISKPFLATLAMTLVQDGLLELDAPPPGTRTDATLRQLLSHQGALACEWPSPIDAFGTDDDALLRLAEGEPRRLPFAPGELFSYSNVGFWLVGAATARACGTSFEEAMRRRVLEPLGLESTGYEAKRPVPGHDQVEPGGDEHRPVEHDYPRVRRPSGGLWSSVDDLLRFAAHQLGGPGPLTPASLQELQRPLVAGPGFEHGLGWSLTQRVGGLSVEHGGSAAGYQSLLILAPNARLAFAALTNSSRGRAAINDLLDRLGLSSPVPDDFPLEPEALGAFTGTFEGPGVRIEVVPEGRHLRFAYSEGDPFSRKWLAYPPVRARPVEAREFELVEGEWQGERLGFPRDDVVCFGVVAQRVS
jgi:CubicO group peptidase (beta-lactamase class C family)